MRRGAGSAGAPYLVTSHDGAGGAPDKSADRYQPHSSVDSVQIPLLSQD